MYREDWLSLLFLIYINDLLRGLHADIKLLDDDTSLFSDVDDIDKSESEINSDITKMQDCDSF